MNDDCLSRMFGGVQVRYCCYDKGLISGGVDAA